MQPYQPNLAGKGRRFANFLIDYVAILVLGLVVGIIMGVVMGSAAEAALEGWRAYLFGGLVYAGYYAVMEAAGGRTLGKLATGTTVVDEQGGKPTHQQILIRSVARLIPFEPFSVLLVDDARGWHDSLAKTYVVRTRAAPATT